MIKQSNFYEFFMTHPTSSIDFSMIDLYYEYSQNVFLIVSIVLLFIKKLGAQTKPK